MILVSGLWEGLKLYKSTLIHILSGKSVLNQLKAVVAWLFGSSATNVDKITDLNLIHEP